MSAVCANRLRRAIARFEKSEGTARGIPRRDLLNALHLTSMASEYLNQLTECVENQTSVANDETEILVLALDVALEARTLLRAVHDALERLEEGIGNPWVAPLSNLRRA